MINVLVQHEVTDYSAWKSAFDTAHEWRRQNGELSCRIYHGSDNVNNLTLLFEWTNLDQARAFMSSPELKDRMAKAGVQGQPRVDFLTEIHSLRRSAAD